MAKLDFSLDDVKPLLSAVGLGDAPPAPKPVNDQPPPPLQIPPTPAAAGFTEWASDPQNASKVADGITPPGAPLLPPTPAPTLGANVPLPPNLPSVMPPQRDTSFLTPPTQAADPMAAKLASDQVEQARLQSSGSGVSQIKNPVLRTLGRIGDVAGSIISPRAFAQIPGTTAHNQILQTQAGQRVTGDQAALKDAATLTDMQSQAAQRAALGEKASQQAADLVPVSLTKEQAAAINQPSLEGTGMTPRDYNRLVGLAGNNKTSLLNNQNTNDTKVKLAATKEEVAAMKPKQRDDQYIAIMSKPSAERTPDELAYKSGYEQYIKTSKTDPGVARGVASAMARPLQTVDPNSNNVIYQTAGNAIKNGSAAPTSMDYVAGKSLQKDFTSGSAAKNLNAFNTATAHLDTLGQAAVALHNGDVQAINRIGNAYNKQTGSPAPTNFDAVKNAVAGEVSKTFKGGGATDAEIKEANDTISNASSPAQLRGVIETYKDLMQSKRQALQDQYTQGMQGKPNFGTGTGGITPPPTGGTPAENATKTNSHGDKVIFKGGKWGPA